jgi:hypothetical protein
VSVLQQEAVTLRGEVTTAAARSRQPWRSSVSASCAVLCRAVLCRVSCSPRMVCKACSIRRSHMLQLGVQVHERSNVGFWVPRTNFHSLVVHQACRGHQVRYVQRGLLL